MSAVAVSYPYSPGLEGVPAGITRISEIDSAKSLLVYRGYDVHELAENGTYEEAAYLLLYGELPNKAQLKDFSARLGAERDVPESIYDALAAMPKDTHPMDSIRSAFSLLAPHDPDYRAPATDTEANLRKAERIIAKAGTLVANGWRVQHGYEPVRPRPEHATAESFLFLLNGAEPDEYTRRIFDVSMILYAEHSFNASTFACRVCVSTLSDLYSGIVAGISTLRGPLHGGANEEAMHMLLEIGSPENAHAWLEDALANKKKIMGFGHREYKNGDSRAIYLSKLAKEIGVKKGNTTFGEIADILEKEMLEKKNIRPNVDFPTAYSYYLLGIPIDLYTPIFVTSRVAGYSAHAIEQLSNNRLIRPKSIYEGGFDKPYIPLDKRP
jgi:2-methylcitrate synthase/citrate synthase II